MARAISAAGIVLFLVLTTWGITPASAVVTSNTLAAYCSPSGDVCFRAVVKNGTVRLGITTAARYFARYTLCVRPPGVGAVARIRCGSFPIFRGSKVWYGSVRLLPTFPGGQPGAYRVTWKLDGVPLGPTLQFRLPLG